MAAKKIARAWRGQESRSVFRSIFAKPRGPMAAEAACELLRGRPLTTRFDMVQVEIPVGSRKRVLSASGGAASCARCAEQLSKVQKTVVH